MELGQLFLDLALEGFIALMRLSMGSGRILYAALGFSPSREIMVLTGLSMWCLIGAIAYWVWFS